MQRLGRMKRELEMFERSPPPGISCSMKSDSSDSLEAQIIGAENTPYNGGLFHLEIQLPERYPFEPPKVRFVTPIYHPNIDAAGRICLDILKMPPNGNWKPSLNLLTLLTSIQLLMSDPNPDDPLMHDISNEFKYNREQFMKTAVAWTKRHALTTNCLATSSKNKGPQNNLQGDSFSDSSSSDEEIENNKIENNNKENNMMIKRKAGLAPSDKNTKKAKHNGNQCC